MPKQRGRKPLNEAKYFKKIKRYVNDGLSPLQSAKLSGISHETYYKWLEKFPELTEIIETAESDLEHKLVKTAAKTAIETKNVQAIVSLLEHRFKDRWSPKVINELTGSNGDSVVFKIDASGGYIPPENVLNLPSTLTVMKSTTYSDKEKKAVEPS